MTEKKHIEAVLRASGEFDVDRLLSEFPYITPDAIWREGDIKGRPKARGFNLLLFECSVSTDISAELLIALSRHRSMMSRLPLGSAEIDLGVFVTGVMGSVALNPQALGLAAELGLKVTFTFYPTQD